MEYHVLKNGRTEGPFSEAELVGFLEAGRFSPEDLVQAGDSRFWVRARRLFAVEINDTPTTAVRRKVTFFRQTSLRVAAQIRGVFERHPLETGVLCLLVACIVVVLSYLPILIFGPWLLGAMAAAGLLMTRGRVVAGLFLATAAVFLPIALWLLMSRVLGTLWSR